MIGVLALLGVAILVQAAAVILCLIVVWIVLDEQRSWWGPGPRRMLATPADRRRIVRSSLLLGFAAIGIMSVIVIALTATGVVRPG